MAVVDSNPQMFDDSRRWANDGRDGTRPACPRCWASGGLPAVRRRAGLHEVLGVGAGLAERLEVEAGLPVQVGAGAGLSEPESLEAGLVELLVADTAA